MDELRKEVEEIKARNKRVELDKAWETSWTRRVTIAIVTYILVVIIFSIIQIPKPFYSAIVPAIAYLLSTMSLEFVKQKWIARQKKS